MRRLFGFLTFITLIFTVVYVAPSSANSKGIPNENAVGYWTDEMMRNAKPISVIRDSQTGVANKVIEPTLANTASGADWSDGGLPQSAVGKVFFTSGNSSYVCSGSLLNDGNFSDGKSIVITAGHCVTDGPGQFVTNFIFVPNYDDDVKDKKIEASNKYRATALVVREEFVNNAVAFNGTALQHDWGFAVLDGNADNLKYVSQTSSSFLPFQTGGSFELDVIGFNQGDISTALGYPAQGKYNGLSLKYARGVIFKDVYTGSSTWGMNSDLTGGASGGPWLSALTLDFTGGYISSVNSYKYKSDAKRMYGPIFNDKTAVTFCFAKTANENTTVISTASCS